MERLPLELVVEIFQLSQEGLEDMEDWYRIRLVGRSWKGTVDRAPPLWRRVDTAAGHKFVDKQLERAKGVSLWVQADISQQKPYGRVWVQDHRDVIERLALFVESHETRDSMRIVAGMLDEIHFPILRDFRVRRAGCSGGRLISLPDLPDTFARPSALSHLEFTGVSYPIPALASNVNICSLRLDYENSSFKIPLAELQALLPLLPTLTSLTLGGRLEIEADDVKPSPSALPHLKRFSFFGRIETLEQLLCAFTMPSIEHWRLRTKVGRNGIPTPCGMRSIMKEYVGVLTKVVLSWLSQDISTAKVADCASPPRFDLKLIARRGAPFKTLSDFLTGVESLPSVRDLELHGGGRFLDVCEPDDDVIDGVLVALRSLERVVVSGNGNTWVRVPVVLGRRVVMEDVLWRNVERVTFSKVTMLPYVVNDWVGYLWRMKCSGRVLPILKIRDWKIATDTEWECEELAEALKDVVAMVDGEPSKLDRKKVKYT